MTSVYGPLTFLRSRRVLSTAAGVLLLGVFGSWWSYRGATVILLNPNAERWKLSHPMLLALICAALISLNTLPRCPEWEKPLRSRVRWAHTTIWVGLSCLGALGPVLSQARVAAIEPRLGWHVDLAFYLSALGLMTTAALRFGRAAGCVLAIAGLFVIIAIEQWIGWMGLIADVHHPPQWALPSIACTLALVMTWRSAGHLPQGKE